MESIEKLRSVVLNIRLRVPKSLVTTYCNKEGEISDYDMRSALAMAIDEIEQELEERYVELPVDSEDVPINPGERFTDGEYTFTVASMAYYGHGSWSVLNEEGNAWACCDVEHVSDPCKDRA